MTAQQIKTDTLTATEGRPATVSKAALHRWATYIADPKTDYPNAVKAVARAYLELACPECESAATEETRDGQVR